MSERSDVEEAVENNVYKIETCRIVEVKVCGWTYDRVEMRGANLRAEASKIFDGLVATGHLDAVIIEQ